MPNSMKISRPVASDASANKVVDESKKIGAMKISLELVQKWWMPKKVALFLLEGKLMIR